MNNNILMNLPSLETMRNGSSYRMSAAQQKKVRSLIRRECCNYDSGECLLLDAGDSCICPQIISHGICCKWFRWAVLPSDNLLEADIFRDDRVKRCVVCGIDFVPGSNRAKYCSNCSKRVRRRKKTENERKRRVKVDI